MIVSLFHCPTTHGRSVLTHCRLILMSAPLRSISLMARSIGAASFLKVAD